MSKIFDSIVDVENYLGVPVAIPSDIPDDCNVLVYSETTGETPSFYKECDSSLYYIDRLSGERWKIPRISLEKEVDWDKCYGYKLAYLRLATKDNSDVFTPERLLGIETTKGFITNVVEIGFLDIMNPSYFVYTTESLHKKDLYDVHNLKFFISDYYDAVVSFNDYIGMFYEG